MIALLMPLPQGPLVEAQLLKAHEHFTARDFCDLNTHTQGCRSCSYVVRNSGSNRQLCPEGSARYRRWLCSLTAWSDAIRARPA